MGKKRSFLCFLHCLFSLSSFFFSVYYYPVYLLETFLHYFKQNACNHSINIDGGMYLVYIRAEIYEVTFELGFSKKGSNI